MKGRTRSGNYGPLSDYLGGQFGSPYARYQYSQLPIVGDWMRASDQQKYWNDYLSARGWTWDNVKYPALLGGTSVGGAISNTASSSASMMISRNLIRLYR